MPIYEFLCCQCNRIYSFHSFKVASSKVPVCPKCSASDLRRVPSSFGISSAPKATDGGGAAGDGPDFDDPRVEREMMRFGSELENMDENDPKAMAEAAKAMQGKMPAGMPGLGGGMGLPPGLSGFGKKK